MCEHKGEFIHGSYNYTDTIYTVTTPRTIRDSYGYTTMRKYDHCEYCGEYKRMTKEHVVPRCYGGLLKIWVCSDCNNQRGDSGNHPLFLTWLDAHKDTFKQAVIQTRDKKQTNTWLSLNGLDIYQVSTY